MRMNRYCPIDRLALVAAALASALASIAALHGQQIRSGSASAPAAKTITAADCTAAKLGSQIPVKAIGEPVSAVILSAPQWRPETANAPDYCSIEGSMAPVHMRCPVEDQSITHSTPVADLCPHRWPMRNPDCE
jgi:hypothetical protein